jgi:ABC-type transporter Mla MlaB component
VADRDDPTIPKPTRSEGGTGAPSFEFQLQTPASPDAIEALCRRVRRALRGTDDIVLICDLQRVTEPDVTVIEALARMQLTARRLGRSIELRHACPQVQELVRLAGLADVLPVTVELPVDPVDPGR